MPRDRVVVRHALMNRLTLLQHWYAAAGWAVVLSGLIAAGSAALAVARRAVRRRVLRRRDARRAAYAAALDEGLSALPDHDLPRGSLRSEMDETWLACMAERFDAGDDATRARVASLCERLRYLERFRARSWSWRAAQREQASRWLGRLAEHGVSDLVRLMNDPSVRVRSAAIVALGGLNDPRALSALLRALDAVASTPSHWWRIGDPPRRSTPMILLAQALTAQGPKAIFPLLSRLRSPSSAVRLAVAEVLSRAPDPHPRVRAALLGALADEDPEVRARAAKALGLVGYTGAMVPLVRALSDPLWFVRLHAARALGLLGHPRAIPGLLGVLTDEWWQVRAAAAHALRRLGEPAVPALTDYLFTSRDRYAKEQVVEELQRTSFLHGQIEALDAVRPGAAFAALRLLREAALHGAVQIALSALRRHPRPAVRRRLVAMLAVLDAHQVIGALHEAAERDPDPGVRESARRALTGSRPRSPVRAATGHAA